MDVASKQQKTLKNVLYYGLPVLAILMIAVGWVLFSGSHPELMPAPADVWARFVKTFTKPIAKTSLAGHAWASLRRVLMALLIAWAFGISFGILIGWNKKCKAFFGSIFEVIRPHSAHCLDSHCNHVVRHRRISKGAAGVHRNLCAVSHQHLHGN